MDNKNMTEEELQRLLQSDRESKIRGRFIRPCTEFDMFMDWLKETHPDIRLTKSQQSITRDVFNIVYYGCGRGFGKSFLLRLWKEYDERWHKSENETSSK